MKLLATVIIMLCTAAVFAQDSTAAMLSGYKELYDHKKITLQKYQQLSNELLRLQEASLPATTKQQQDTKAETAPKPLAVPTIQTEATFDTTNYPRTEEYCLLVGYISALNSKVEIEVQFGQGKNETGSNSSTNKSGRMPQFDNMVDALNFMNSKGWQLAQAYEKNTGTNLAYNYLLKRKR